MTSTATTALDITYRQDLIDTISADFDLRPHNTEALEAVIKRLAYGYDPAVQQVCHMATGAGKTYLMAALIEYLRQQGVYNVLVVTPGLVVQAKTMANFTPGHPKFVAGAQVPPVVYSPHTLNSTLFGRVSGGQEASTVYVFNIQQLIGPKDLSGETKSGGNRAVQRGLRRDNEVYGNTFARLQEMDDLVVIADESHLYSASAKAFNSALAELAPAAAIGLTASASDDDEIVFHYPLYQAISDRCVKTPVLTFREGGYPPGSDELQLADAMKLLDIKARHYANWAELNGRAPITPVLMVTCANIDHAKEVTELLSGPEFFGDPEAVLRVDSESINDEVRFRLDNLDAEGSTVRAVVSVAMLREGWDVKNVAVLCALRASTSDVLTEQTMGRGLRLPYGQYTGVGHVDQLDIISHESYRAMLTSAEVLQEFGLTGTVRPGEDLKEVVPTPEDPAPVPETDAEDVHDDDQSGQDHPTPGIRSLDRTLEVGVPDETVLIGRTGAGQGVAFDFPSTTLTRTAESVPLEDLTSENIEQAASLVSATGPVLEREMLSNFSDDEIRTRTTHQAYGAAVEVDPAEVLPALVKAIFRSRGVVKDARNYDQAKKRIVPDFIKAVTTEWTVQSLASAESEVAAMVTRLVTEKRSEATPRTDITSVRLPADETVVLPPGTKIHDRLSDRKGFVAGRLYGPWEQSVFESVSFDAYSTEYRIAELADKSEAVSWWYRLGPSDGARIAYSGGNYHPDFVVYDTDEDLYWIVEGKADSGRGEDDVQAKRKAAQTLVSKARVDDAVPGRWAYLLAYESDLDNARSWDDLKARADTVRP